MKKLLLLVTALSIAVRLYPTLLSGLPFSTDAWSPIRNTELILKHTPVKLDSGILDNYNCYWPANSIFGTSISIITGMKPIDAMRIFIPLSGSMTVLIFYVLVKRISRSYSVACLSSAFLATAYSYAFFTAGVTKETYANPIYMLSILFFLENCFTGFLISSLALVMAHHLTTAVTITVLASITIADYVIKKGSKERSRIAFLSALIAITLLYFQLYAKNGMKISVTPSDLLSVASYQVIFFFIALYLSERERTVPSVVAPIFTFLIALLWIKGDVVPGAPKLPAHYLIYALPFVLISPLAFLGLKGKEVIFWLSATLGLEAYSVFSNPPIALAYRILNFIWPPLAAISAMGSRDIKKVIKILAILIIALNLYSIYAAVSLGERYMGYFWLYNQQEYLAASWLSSSNLTVSCDVKASYLLSDYFNMRTDVFKYLRGKPELFFLYGEMLRNGYVLYGGYIMDFDLRKLLDFSLIYSNGRVEIYG